MAKHAANVLSEAIKVLDGYRNAQGQHDQLGFIAMFVPTFAGDGAGTMFSQFPALDNPRLAVNAYHGILAGENVYQLNTKKLKQFKGADGKILKARLKPGETMTLPGGNGSITFEKDIRQWVGFQVVQQPGTGWALGGSIAATLGLAASLFIQRRRVWVRATTGTDGVTVVEMAGLGRSESAKLSEELGDLAALVHDRAPTKTDDPDADPDQEPDAAPPVPAAEGAQTK